MFNWLTPKPVEIKIVDPITVNVNLTINVDGKEPPVVSLPKPGPMKVGKGESFMFIAFPVDVPPAQVTAPAVPPARTVVVITLADGTRKEKTYDGNGGKNLWTRGVPKDSANLKITSYFEDASSNKSDESDPIEIALATDETPDPKPGQLSVGKGQEVSEE